jgi:hypothetical protein
MAIPRQVLLIAIGAVATGAYLVLRNKMQAKKANERRSDSSGSSASSSTSSGTTSGTSGTSSTGAAPPTGASETPGLSGSMRELALFLAGESWYDEVGWQGIWEREGVGSPEEWLRTQGKEVLISERKKLAEHPALLAGCRRRWIVVCRYAGIDVSDAASLWNATEA